MVRTSSGKIGTILVHLFFILFSAFCVLPMFLIVSASFSTEADIVNYGYRLIPKTLTLSAYRYVLSNPAQILNAYGVTTTVTFCGTLASLVIISMIAYTLSRREYKFKGVLSFYVFFTMLFSGGLVPTYILITKYLHLKNSIWALILPMLVSPWNIMLLRTFFSKIPYSLSESAKIDGASEFKIYYAIVLPLSKPALATVGLFISLAYWNDWWLSLLYITEERLVPLQFMLQRIMSNIEFMTKNAQHMAGMNVADLPSESARMAMCVLAAGPMLFVFPFFQKYFVKGITVGAIKG